MKPILNKIAKLQSQYVLNVPNKGIHLRTALGLFVATFVVVEKIKI